MTAYVNDEQKKEGAYGKAVKATLAATLAAGMVPAAAAFAEEPAEATAEGNDAELLWAGEAEHFANGSLTSVVDAAGTVTEVEGNTLVVTAGSVAGESMYINTYLPEGGTAGLDDIELGAGKYVESSAFAASAAGSWTWEDTKGVNWTKAGEYKGLVFKYKAADGSTYTSKPFDVKVVAGDLAAYTVFNAANDNEDTTKTAFIYNGGTIDLGLAKNGTEVAQSDVKILGVFAKNDPACTNDLNNGVLAAGDYRVKLQGFGAVKYVDITVDKLDLAKADLDVEDVLSSKTDNALTIYSPSKSVPQAVINMLAISECDPFNGAGTYKATIAKNADNKDNESIVNTKTVEFVMAEKMISDAMIKYGDTAWSAVNFGTVETTDEDAAYFDASKVVVKDGDKTLKQGTDYEIVVTDKDGNAASVEDLKKIGEWKVAIKGCSEKYAGSSAVKDVKVTAGKLGDANLTFKFDDEVKTANFNVTYDGEDILDKTEIVVTGKDGKALVEGTDYDVVVKNKDGKEVDSAVDAGQYTFEVKSDSYEISGTKTMVITVDPKTVNYPVLGNQTVTIEKDGKEITGVPYTGSNIDLVVNYYAGTVNGVKTYKPVPASEYTYTLVKDGKKVAAVNEPGKYTVTVKDAKNGNFAINGTFSFNVISDKVFLDVPTTEWYYDEVLAAYQKGWIKGYSGGNFFGPNDAITRADVCVTLARMAKVDLVIDSIDENAGSEIGFFKTPFADVDGNMYYAQAVAWAAKTGIVSGDSDTGNFRPTDQISREEFAAMLARYAEKNGDDVTADLAALDNYDDASAISGWAKDYVAWAVEAGVMGKDTTVLWPTESITRAAVAAMLVRF